VAQLVLALAPDHAILDAETVLSRGQSVEAVCWLWQQCTQDTGSVVHRSRTRCGLVQSACASASASEEAVLALLELDAADCARRRGEGGGGDGLQFQVFLLQIQVDVCRFMYRVILRDDMGPSRAARLWVSQATLRRWLPMRDGYSEFELLCAVLATSCRRPLLAAFGLEHERLAAAGNAAAAAVAKRAADWWSAHLADKRRRRAWATRFREASLARHVARRLQSAARLVPGGTADDGAGIDCHSLRPSKRPRLDPGHGAMTIGFASN